MADDELKILEKCPMCGKELKTKTDVIVEQECDCGFSINYLPPVDGDFDNKIMNSCCIEISVFGRKNIEALLGRIVTSVPPVAGFPIVRSERDEIKCILDVCRGLEKEYGTAERDAIVLLAFQDHGIDPDRVKELIKILKRRAELYEPRHGHYKIV